MQLTEVLAFIVYGTCLLVYHLAYLQLTEKEPTLTKKGRINECIRSWLNQSREGREYLLIVHQIRNMIMSITFLASTSVLLIGFLLTYGLTQTPLSGNELLITPVDYPGWLAFFTLTYSFLNLLLGLRHLNNLTVLVRADREKLNEIEDKPALSYLEKLFIKGSQRYMLGRRSFIYAIVALFWYVNVWVFIGLTVLLTFIFSYQHDF